MRWWLLALALASCGAPARAARPGTLVARARPAASAPIPSCDDLHAGAEGARACAIATLDAAAGAMDVFLRVEPGALPPSRTEVVVAFGDEERSLGAATEAVELRYRVPLAPERRPGGSWRHDAGWHLAGASFLPEIRVDGVVVSVPATLLLEVGDAPLYSSAGPGHRVFEAASFARLAEESFEVGALAMSRREVEEDTLWIGGTGRTDGELELTADTVASAYRQLHDMLGVAPTGSLLVVLHPADGAPWGRRSGSSLVWSLDTFEDPSAAVADALRPLVQLWIVGAEDEPWLREGVPEYLATLVAVDLLGMGEQALARAMLRRASGLRIAPSAEEPSAPDPTATGALAGYCLDGYLRESSSSLAAVLRGPRRQPLSGEALLADVAAISAPAAGYLAALVGDRGAFSIDECLERAGFRAETHTFEGSTDAWIAEALGIEAWGPMPTLPALRIEAVAEGSSLLAGDLLVRVGAHPVADVGDVAWALHQHGRSAPLELGVRRRGQASVVSLMPDALPEADLEERTHVALHPVDAAP